MIKRKRNLVDLYELCIVRFSVQVDKKGTTFVPDGSDCHLFALWHDRLEFWLTAWKCWSMPIDSDVASCFKWFQGFEIIVIEFLRYCHERTCTRCWCVLTIVTELFRCCHERICIRCWRTVTVNFNKGFSIALFCQWRLLGDFLRYLALWDYYILFYCKGNRTDILKVVRFYHDPLIFLWKFISYFNTITFQRIGGLLNFLLAILIRLLIYWMARWFNINSIYHFYIRFLNRSDSSFDFLPVYSNLLQIIPLFFSFSLTH